MLEKRLILASAMLAIVIGCASPSRNSSIDLARPDYDKGLAAFEKGEYIIAIRHFSEAIEKDPDFADAYFRRGSARLRLVMRKEISAESHEVDRAAADFSEALRILPVHYEAAYNRGLAYAALARYREAAQDLKNATQSREVELQRDANAQLAQILEEKFEGMEAQALRHYEKYVELGGKDPAVQERYMALRSREVESTRRLTQEAEANALFIEAMRLAQAANKARAIETLEKAMAAGPLPADKREFAATVYAQWKQEVLAEASAAALLKEAQSLVKEGNKDLAMKLLERAMQQYPNTRVAREQAAPLLKSLKAEPPK